MPSDDAGPAYSYRIITTLLLTAAKISGPERTGSHRFHVDDDCRTYSRSTAVCCEYCLTAFSRLLFLFFLSPACLVVRTHT